MYTTDLFNFRFVDRDESRNKFNHFFANSDGNVLWVKGNRGLGKTTFIKFMLEEHPQYTLCDFDVPKDSDSIEIISDFIKQLEQKCDFSFVEETQKCYKEFYSNTYKVISKITTALFPKINNIIEAVLSTGYYVITKSDDKKESIDIVYHFISLILSQKKLCICIDNLSRCNMDTLHFFFKLIKNFLSEENFRACIVTTTEDLKPDIKNEIFHFLPFTDIEIRRFEKYEYFFQILEPIFYLGNFKEEDFEYIFLKCEGSPKKLSTIISKLLENQGISLYKNQKAIINKATLFSILQSETIKFKDSDFSSPQKWIIFSFICIGEKIPMKYLRDLALYIADKFLVYITYDIHLFHLEFLNLIENRILQYDDKNDLVDTCHDEDFFELEDIFRTSPISGMFSSRTAEFFTMHKEYINYEKIICKNAMYANHADWERMNFRYGKKLFRQKQYQDAQQIFSRLANSFHKMSPVQVFVIGINSYETGNFKLAITQFLYLQPESLRFKKLKYAYHYYLAKSYNNIGNVSEAVRILEAMIGELPEKGREYLTVSNLLQMYYLEIPEKIEDAKRIFENILNNYQKTFPEIWANTMRGCQNFKKGRDALDILNSAEKLLSDDLEKAFLINTRGFVFVKSNQLEKGQECFQMASKRIKQLKKHEYTYAANNLAVCQMLNCKFGVAREILLEALFWNRTVYGELVIQTHLMICSEYLNYTEDTDYYYKVLEKYMEDNPPVDYTINRKIYMNLAIIDHIRENRIAEDAHLRNAEKYVKDTSSEWLYHILRDDFEYHPFDTPSYRTPKFEP
ncbi:MAG: P-loop NTPase fold protein [Oscillospiraceae bacterium]|nr:P-loop NTPase fold protein [Oscillospiraceae bacterium]